MSKLTARNTLVVIGLWTFSRTMAFWFIVLIGVTHIRMTFTGDVGIVMMWLWEGFPYDLFAVLAAITLAGVIETENPLTWVGILAALYLYSEGMQAWRTLSHGWHETPRTSDYIGILTQAMIPALACFIAGTWWTKRSVAPKVAIT
jgi:hypothetical protein